MLAPALGRACRVEHRFGLVGVKGGIFTTTRRVSEISFLGAFLLLSFCSSGCGLESECARRGAPRYPAPLLVVTSGETWILGREVTPLHNVRAAGIACAA